MSVYLTPRGETVHVSSGNSKIGETPNVSMPPIVSCSGAFGGRAPPCARECYASKAWRQYPGVRAAWTNNHAAYLRDPSGYFAAIAAHVRRTHPARFRWHSAGDIPDRAYLRGMVDMALEFPGTVFAGFSKQYHLFAGIVLPTNLVIRLSTWPGLDAPPPGHSVAHFIPLGRSAPSGVKVCPGGCVDCGFACWSNREDVAFHQH